MAGLVSKATSFVARCQDLGWKEAALRIYRTGDIHHIWGNEVGRDAAGNIYYEAMPGTIMMGRDRWVWYKDYKKAEASTIPPEWHSWLHNMVDEVPNNQVLSSYIPHFQKPRTPNKTGTSDAYSAPGYIGNKNHEPVKQRWTKWEPNTENQSESSSQKKSPEQKTQSESML